MKTLWICGQYKSGDEGNIVWDFQGVFDTEELAIAACVDNTYFVGLAELNKELPKATAKQWPGVYYPKG